MTSIPETADISVLDRVRTELMERTEAQAKAIAMMVHENLMRPGADFAALAAATVPVAVVAHETIIWS